VLTLVTPAAAAAAAAAADIDHRNLEIRTVQENYVVDKS
jgi:hypothetical protein